MNIFWHGVSALPFIALDMYETAIGCVIMDLTWILNEAKFRLSGEKDFGKWINTVSESNIIPYRIAHSLFFILTIAIWYPLLAAGMLIHLALDLPTHRGRMQQQPFYPIKWRWPWIL